MILIVASEMDPHTDSVILALRGRGFDDILRLDFETAFERFDATVENQGDMLAASSLTSRLATPRKHFVSAVKTVWYRRALNYFNPRFSNFPSVESLDQAEAYWLARWLVESLPPSCFPLGDPATMRAAENKILQLRAARKAGFTVPDTIISNDNLALQQFCARHDRVVVKPLHVTAVAGGPAGGQGADLALIARGVPGDRLLEKLRSAPKACLFCQELVNKTADARVNVLPGKTVACRIDNAKLAPGEVDWRPTTYDHEHEIIEWPGEVDRQCRRYLDGLGLRCGAFDFGLTPDGRWVFFECNPNGQWLWIETKTGYPLSRDIADELLAHHEGAEAGGRPR